MGTIHSYLRGSVLITAVAMTAACENNYNITSPANKSMHKQAPTTFSIDYRQAPTELPTITLNGQSVEGMFTQEELTATANGEDLASMFVQGKNQLQVDPPNGPKVSFIYDTYGPEIIVVSTDRSDGILVQGTSIDSVGIKSATVNGSALNVNKQGAFSIKVTESDSYEFVAEDLLGNVSTSYFQDYGKVSKPAFRVSIRDSALNFMADELKTTINEINYNDLVAGEVFFSDTKPDAFGNKTGPEAFISRLSMTLDSLTLDSTDAGLTMAGQINDFDLRVTLVMYGGILPTVFIDPKALIKTINISRNIEISVQDNKPTMVMGPLDVEVGDIDFDLGLGIFEPLFTPITKAIEDSIRESIAEAINDPLNASLETQFAEIIPTTYDLDVNEENFTVTLALDSLSTAEGEIIMDLAGGIQSEDAILGPANTKEVPSPTSETTDIGVSINTNLFNQALNLASIASLDNMTIPAGEGQIIVESMVSPYISFKDDTATLSIRGLKVNYEAKADGKSTFYARVNADTKINIGIKPGNKIAMSFDEEPTVDVIETVFIDSIPLPNAFLGDIINDALPEVMASISTALSDIEIPAFGEYTITADTVSDVNGHLGVAGSLERTPDTGTESDSQE